MKTLANPYPVTFLNGEEELIERGKDSLLSRKEDVEFYVDAGMNEDIEETRERLRMENFSFSELKKRLEQAEDLPPFYDYGLGFDLVEAGTFEDQKEGYYRFQFSWGGPSEEIRFYYDGSIEFIFLDWFVGVGFDITGEYWAEWIETFFSDIGSLTWDLSPEQISIPEEDEEDEEE